jgi:hypothetical protein
MPFIAPPGFLELSPSERTRMVQQQEDEVHRFYSGKYQEIRRYFEHVFPTAGWKREKIAFHHWCKIAQVPPYLSHDYGGIWNVEQCWKLSATADEFCRFLDRVKSNEERPAPDWANDLPPPADPTLCRPHSGSFAPPVQHEKTRPSLGG